MNHLSKPGTGKRRMKQRDTMESLVTSKFTENGNQWVEDDKVLFSNYKSDS